MATDKKGKINVVGTHVGMGHWGEKKIGGPPHQKKYVTIPNSVRGEKRVPDLRRVRGGKGKSSGKV